jgi:hypothetical protein
MKISQTYTGDIDVLIEELKEKGFEVPENFAEMTRDDVIAWATEVGADAETINNIANRMSEFAASQRMLAEQQQELQEQAKQEIEAKVKTYNFKKAQTVNDIDPFTESMDESPMEDTDEIFTETETIGGELKFEDGGDLKDWLETTDPTNAIDTLANIVNNEPVMDDSGSVVEPMEIIKGGIQRFYQDNISEQERLKIAMEIFDILPNSIKHRKPDEEQTISAPFEPKEIQSFVKDIDQQIKKLAESSIKPKTKSYNLRKTAQEKSMENVLLWGPDEKRIDPFLQQPISDWSIVERNKGFGLTVDDVWNIDWEAIWRGAIMDKYSRPYRDMNGNWVGGYIQKRFEVDKWRPESTNMQLKPGQKRKPRPAEMGVLEARMEAARNGKAINQPVSMSSGKEYIPGTLADKGGEPTDWQKLDFAKFAGKSYFNLIDLKKKVT